MTALHKFRLKKTCFVFVIVGLAFAITRKSEAQRTGRAGIYSTLTSDTIPVRGQGNSRTPLPLLSRVDSTSRIADTIPIRDSTVIANSRDSFSFKLSKDTLDAPVEYEAADSGVLLIKEKKFLLYGKTSTTYKDIKLTAPTVEFDQATNILTAMRDVDSFGVTSTRAVFSQGEQGFQSDTIRFNFKTKRGLTTNTYTQQGEGLFVSGRTIKKINDSVAFIKHMTMTTCDLDDPHFGFIANKGKFVTNKIAVTGPIHPEFEGVPLPVYLPFGIFPINRQRHSGLLPPQFTVNQDFGLGLEGLGYYHVLNDYVDVTLRTNIYSYGGWTASLSPSYRKLYRYQGGLSLAFQHNKFNFKGDPDYRLVKTFNISWTHAIDQRARPGTNFSANVNAGSTRFNENIPNNPNQNLQNQLSSSINYTKTWKNKPFNLTLSANHNQNNATRLVNLILPDAGFTVSTIYPFQKKEAAGTPKWWEKVGVGYSTVLRNQVSFYDTVKNVAKVITDTLQWGAQHRFPINVSLPALGPVLVSPFVSYEETWLTRRMRYQWNEAAQKLDTVSDVKGLFIDRQMSFGISLNTAVFGTFQFKKGKVKAIRHVIRPSASANYRPNMSKKYYDLVRTSSFNPNKQPLGQFSGANLFGQYGYGRFGGMTFQVDNNLEMKVKSKKDTVKGEKIVRLIDGFGFSSAYNFLRDSMRLEPFNLYFRTTLIEKINITAQGVYNPYQRDPLGLYIDRFIWQGDRFRLGRINSGSVSMSTSFQSKPRDGQKKATETPASESRITDPNMLADRERMQDYMRRNPAEFVDFNVPWTLSLSYSLNFNEQRRENNTYFTKVSSNVSFNNSFSLTPKWNFSTNGFFDFDTKQLTMFTMSISRDMHCWQMSVNVTPIGNYRFFSINISPKSTLLQDLKVNRTRYFNNNY